MVDAEFTAIQEQATFLRSAFEHILFDARGTSETRGACLHASILLSQILSKFACAPCRVRGGGPPMDGGLRDQVGVLQGHYWVEGRTASGQLFVADITADQFGFNPVIVLTEAEARVRYFPGDQGLVDMHAEEELSSWAGSAG